MAEAKTEKKGNQSEGEFFALVGTGTKAVEGIFRNYRPQLMQRAAKNVQGDFDVWASRTLFEITSNDQLAPLLNTKAGILSAYKEITRAAVMGLMVGGKKPQSYFVPKDGKLVLIPDARGVIFCCVYGPGAVLAKVPELKKVHEGEDLRIDEAAGVVIYPKGGSAMFPDKKLVGFFMELDYLDGRREVKRVTLEKVRQIEASYGQTGSPMYKKSPEEADEKTAIKYLLRMPFGESEGIAMKRALGDEYEPPAAEPSGDVATRVSERLAAAAEPAEFEVEPQKEAQAEPAKADGTTRTVDVATGEKPKLGPNGEPPEGWELDEKGNLVKALF